MTRREFLRRYLWGGLLALIVPAWLLDRIAPHPVQPAWLFPALQGSLYVSNPLAALLEKEAVCPTPPTWRRASPNATAAAPLKSWPDTGTPTRSDSGARFRPPESPATAA
jgi:hypothetical protein